MIIYDKEESLYHVTIHGVYRKSFLYEDAAKAFETAKLQGKKDTTKKPKIERGDGLLDVRRFANEFLVLDEDGIVSKDVLFNLYRQSGGRLSRLSFIRKLKRVVDAVGLLLNVQRLDVDGIRKRFVKGVRLK